MSFKILQDVAIADVAIEIEASTLEFVFAEAAEAFWSVQLENPSHVRRRHSETIHLESPQGDLLLYKFLQELVYWKDAKRLILFPDNVQIEKGDPWVLIGTLGGEPYDPARHQQVVDVKAATLHGLVLETAPIGWRARLVLDI